MAVVNCVVFNDIVIVNVLIIDDFCQKKTSFESVSTSKSIQKFPDPKNKHKLPYRIKGEETIV